MSTINQTVKKDVMKERKKLTLYKFRKNKLAMLGLIITVLLIVVAVVSVAISPYDIYEMEVSARLHRPGEGHLFGTDSFGRDLYVRTMYGVLISVLVGGATALFSLIGGVILGLLAGYFKLFDTIIMRICESLMAIPSVLMAVALMSALNATAWNVVLSLSIVYIPQVVKVARASVLSIRAQNYIEAIRSQGATTPRILFKHIAPNIISPVIVQVSFIFANAIIVEAGLSFLAAGIPAPLPSLGNILSEAKEVLLLADYMSVLPGAVMVLLVLGINVLSDGIRDVLDPRA